MRQILGELYLRAFSVCAMVLKDEVQDPGAVGLVCRLCLTAVGVFGAPFAAPCWRCGGLGIRLGCWAFTPVGPLPCVPWIGPLC